MILSNSNSVSPTFSPGFAGTYEFKLIVNDGRFNSAPDIVTITVNNIQSTNNSPIANAGADQTVNTGLKVTLNGANSIDPDGNNFTYSWTQTSGTDVTLSDSTSVAPTFTPNLTGTYEFQLILNDGQVDSAPDTVKIKVHNLLNNPPIANAGADQSVNVNTQVTLDATGSSDSDGDTLTYLWTQTSGTNVILSDSTSVSPEFTPNLAGTYEFQIIVNDGQADSAPDTVKIEVNNLPNNPPIANAGRDQSVDVDTQVTLYATGSSDPDGDTLTYSWTQTSGTNAALSDSTSVSPEFTPNLAGTYEFQLIVNDGQVNSTPDTVIITVNDKNGTNSVSETKSKKKVCAITNTIKNKNTISIINSIKDKYLLQNMLTKYIVDLYYKVNIK
ncbi:hypothetical protein HY745_07600 [Candidatus Desantisbacteria bacterium]|nr:hypothetical protein [Candidatus Desantisbacteria bacterium]